MMKKKLLTLILSLLTALTITSFPANMAGISIFHFKVGLLIKKINTLPRQTVPCNSLRGTSSFPFLRTGPQSQWHRKDIFLQP